MIDPPSFYTGWLVAPIERQALLRRFPPRYAIVVAHHVTQTFGDRAAKAPANVTAQIVGEADDGAGVQALVVTIGDSTARPDGGTYHITWSLSAGRAARESNAVIAERGWTPIATAIRVTLLSIPDEA